MDDELTDMSKEEKLAVLYGVCKLLPLGKVLEPAVVHLIRRYLQASYIDSSKVVYTKAVLNLQVDITETFEDISTQEFSHFALSVSDATLSSFINNETHFFKRTREINTSNDSIRLFAAFLVIDHASPLTIDDLIYRDLQFGAGTEVANFISKEHDSDSLQLTHFAGRFDFSTHSAAHSKTSLLSEISSDESHLVVAEIRSIHIKLNNSSFSKSLLFYGWGVITENDTLILFFKSADSGATHNYLNLSVEISASSTLIADSMILLKIDRPIEAQGNHSNLLSQSKLNQFIHQRLLAFEKVENNLTSYKPFDDTNIRKGFFDVPGIKTRYFNPNAIVIKKVKSMDEVEQLKLDKRLYEISSNIDIFDFTEHFALLDKGANINYQDPKTGLTCIHFMASCNLEFLKETLKRARDPYDFLIESKQGKRASQHALDTATSISYYENDDNYKEVYSFLKQKEDDAIASLSQSNLKESEYLDNTVNPDHLDSTPN